MATGGKRKKSKKMAVKARKVVKPQKAEKAPARKKAKASPPKTPKRSAKKASKRMASSRAKSKASMPTVEQIAPSGEPEFVSNASLAKL